jgi:hypothetical protein
MALSPVTEEADLDRGFTIWTTCLSTGFTVVYASTTDHASTGADLRSC